MGVCRVGDRQVARLRHLRSDVHQHPAGRGGAPTAVAAAAASASVALCGQVVLVGRPEKDETRTDFVQRPAAATTLF